MRADLLQEHQKNLQEYARLQDIKKMKDYDLKVANFKELDSKIKTKITKEIRNNLKSIIDNNNTIITFEFKARNYEIQFYIPTFNIYNYEIDCIIETIKYNLVSRPNEEMTTLFNINN